jgi:hypothetical protein
MSTQTINTPAVLTAVQAVMHDIGTVGISKDRKNKDQGFNFRGIDDMLNALSPLLVKHKLIVVPQCENREVIESKTKSGSTMWKVWLKVNYTVYGPDGSTLTACTYGEAMDTADKATNKAMSVALKYLFIQLFAIPVVGTDDPDETTPPETVPMLSAVKMTEIRALLKGKGMDESQLLSWVGTKAGYDIERLEDVPDEAYRMIVNALKKESQQ